MTFSITGRCARTGMFGVGVTTSSIAVGARCPHARAGAGAVSTQNITDPTYGPRILDLLAQGHTAESALARALDGPARFRCAGRNGARLRLAALHVDVERRRPAVLDHVDAVLGCRKRGTGKQRRECNHGPPHRLHGGDTEKHGCYLL